MENKSYLVILLTILFALFFYFVFLDVPRLSPSGTPNYPGGTPPDGTGVDNPPDGTGVDNPPDGTGVDNPPDGTGITPPPDGTGIDPPNISDITLPPEPPIPPTQCSSNIDCNRGLCCVVGGLNPDTCSPINDLHGGICMGGASGGGGVVIPGGNNYPCTANSNCSQGLCCVSGGFLSNRCHPTDRLYGGLCMLSPSPVVNTSLPRHPPPPPPPIPDEDEPFPLKYILLIVLGALLLIGAVIALVIYLKSKNEKLNGQVKRKDGGVALQQGGNKRMPPPSINKISVLTGSENLRRGVMARRPRLRGYPSRARY